MRSALLAFGFLCCFIGAQFLMVDKVVLHAHVASSDAPEKLADTNASQRVIDLPDSGGYVLLTMGTVCFLYFFATRRQRSA